MKNLFLATLIILSLSSFGQSEKSYDSLLIKEVNWFVNKINTHFNKYESTANQYIVYVLYAYGNKSDKNEICFTLGYIMNSYDYRHIRPKYYFKLKNEYVLVRLEEGLTHSCLEDINLLKFNTYNDDAVKIVQKLYPSALGGFTSQPPGMILCKGNNKFNRTYYENADEIPLNKSIWINFPKNGRIDLKRKNGNKK